MLEAAAKKFAASTEQLRGKIRGPGGETGFTGLVNGAISLDDHAILAECERKQHMAPGRFVFPGPRPGRPMSNMAMMMLLRRMGRGELTVHGFRSAFRDWAGNETPFAREVAEAALAHVIGDAAERAYRRGDALEKRRAMMEAWAQWCEPKAANVVPFARAGVDA